MNVSIYLQTAYENKSNWTLGENEPNTNPIKPNLRKAKSLKYPNSVWFKKYAFLRIFVGFFSFFHNFLQFLSIFESTSKNT